MQILRFAQNDRRFFHSFLRPGLPYPLTGLRKTRV